MMKLKDITPDEFKHKRLVWIVPPLLFLVLFILLILKLTIHMDEVAESRAHEKPQGETQTEMTSDSTFDSQVSEAGDVIVEDSTTDLRIESNEVQLELGYIAEDKDGWKLLERNQAFEGEGLWKVFMVQKKDKIDYTVFSPLESSWHPGIEEEKRMVINQIDKNTRNISFDRARKKHFAVQLLSLNEGEFLKAVEVMKFLVKNNYYAYLYRTPRRIKTKSVRVKQYFYRVRVGFFETEREALQIAEKINEQFPDQEVFVEDYWAVNPDFQELSGELIDFGVQRNMPWVIQFSGFEDKLSALNFFQKISPYVDSAHIAQRKGGVERYDYKIQVGFYDTYQNADKKLGGLVAAAGKLTARSKIFNQSQTITPFQLETQR
ncbi:MAG: SPOR domain-containing protein [Deltaproteobacteria bacterium]|nr:SPOR domain-containing protein [Deltaproteobacteria bacterium]